MSNHGATEAKERFSELVERALRGGPVAELRPVSPAAAGMAWLRTHRIQPSRPQPVDATALIRRMRDGD